MTFSGVPNAQNMDALAQAGLSKPIFGLDKEVYMGILLQRAASSKYRYDPAKGTKPSEQFAAVDPTPDSPGIIQSVPSPAHPRSSFVSVSGVLSSVPGYPINRHTLAMSAYQNTLKPPRSHLKRDARLAAEGEAVFRRAGCITCHAGPYLTNNRIVATDVLGTNPSRARSFKKTEKFWGPPLMYDYDTPVPLPKKPKLHRMPLNGMSEEQIRLAFAHGIRRAATRRRACTASIGRRRTCTTAASRPARSRGNTASPGRSNPACCRIRPKVCAR